MKIVNKTGDITLNHITGQTDINTATGDINIKYADNPKSASSYVSLDGNIDVMFQENLSADIYFKTMNGNIFSEFEVKQPASIVEKVKIDKKSDHKFELKSFIQIGKGGIKFNFETLTGDVNIKKML